MKDRFVTIATSLLIILWVYTAGSKILDFQEFGHQLKLQNFAQPLTLLLLWTVPLVETLTAVLLVIERTRPTGLYVSLVLLTVFSFYVALVLLGYFQHTPCSCGGVLQNMGWSVHLLFNLAFTILNILTIHLFHDKERRSGKN